MHIPCTGLKKLLHDKAKYFTAAVIDVCFQLVDVPGMEALIFAETTSIGIRRVRMERTILPRRKRKVMIPFGEVEVKICGSEGAEKCYPEYESLAEICRKTGISYAEAYQMAVDASKNLE